MKKIFFGFLAFFVMIICFASVLAMINAGDIQLTSPADAYNTTNNAIPFVFNVTSSSNATDINCSVYLNNSLYGYNESVLNFTSTTIIPTPIPDGVYSWYVNCTDSDETNQSSSRALTIDTTAPTFSNNSTNSTYAGQAVRHSLKWQDNSLSGYIFSFDNGTGNFINDTWVAMTGASNWSNVTKTVNSTAGSVIRWGVYANDSAGNWNESLNYTYITVDGSAPALTLNLPAANAELSDTTVIFNCSATDATGISNISLYGNWTGYWILNETTNLSGKYNSTNFSSKILATNATYQWACYACDTLNNCNFSSSNQTFIIDQAIPTVRFVYPDDGELYTTTGTTQSVTFYYNVTSHDNFGIANCVLYIDGVANETNGSIVENENQSFSKTLTGSSDGEDYEWYVNCSDYAGNYNYSGTSRTVTVQITGSSNSSGSNSGNNNNNTQDNCPPNQMRCSGGNVEQCLNDEWEITQNCSYGCNPVNLTCETLSEVAFS